MQRKSHSSIKNTCWIPDELRAGRVLTLFETQAIEDCKRYVIELCCKRLSVNLRFPHRINVALDPNMRCTLEDLTTQTRKQFEMAGYAVTLEGSESAPVVVVDLKRKQEDTSSQQQKRALDDDDDSQASPIITRSELVHRKKKSRRVISR